MYGLPFWKYVPAKLSGVFTQLVTHRDNLFYTIGSLVDGTTASGNVNDLSILGKHMAFIYPFDYVEFQLKDHYLVQVVYTTNYMISIASYCFGSGLFWIGHEILKRHNIYSCIFPCFFQQKKISFSFIVFTI